MADSSSADAGQHKHHHLISGGLAVLLLAVLLVPFVQELTAQPAVRYAQSAAMVDQRTIELDAYDRVIGIDRVERNGHIYGDKAPLQPLLGVPIYALARAAGAEPATHLRVQGNLGLWWVTLSSTVIPLLVLAWIGIQAVTRIIGPRRAVQSVLTICGATLLVAYGTQLYAHVLAGLLGWGCWLMADRALQMRNEPSRSRKAMWVAVASGGLGGAAVATEYPLVLVVLVVAGVFVVRRAWTQLLAFAVSGAPFLLLLLGYQWVAYGSPFTVSYSEKPQHETEPLVVGLPSPLRLGEVLLGSRGLVLFAPVVAVAVWGLVRLARSQDRERRLHGTVGLVVCGLFLLMQAGWSNPWGGEAPGPRYVIAALPFLFVGMAEAWDPAGRLRWLVIPWSAFAMGTTVIANHLTPAGSNAVEAQLRHLRTSGPVDTLWTMAFGPLGWVLHLATVAVVAWWLIARLRVEATELGPAVVDDRLAVAEACPDPAT